MSVQLHAEDQVWTSDGQHVGEATHLYHRQEAANPLLELYQSYLHVVSRELGDDYYVPTDFIVRRDEETGHVLLAVTRRQVEERTWTRRPDFVAHGRARVEKLAHRSNGSGATQGSGGR